MKVLYLASQTEQQETLSIEREITSIQQQLSTSAISPSTFVFLPDIDLEDVPIALSRHRPDVVHISAHGSRSGLWFSRGSFGDVPRDVVRLDASSLAEFFDRAHMPKLVFLNACDSSSVAAEIVKTGIACMGTSAPITNRAAVAAAGLLYQRLLGGRSVGEAYRAVSKLVQCLDEGQTSLELLLPVGSDAEKLIVQRVPRLVARLARDARPKRDGPIGLEFGVEGCPPETNQIVFFTNDPTFVVDGEAGQPSEIVRDVPRQGEIWGGRWDVHGDFRMAACGISASGEVFALSAMATEILSSYASTANAASEYMNHLDAGIGYLRAGNEAGLTTWSLPPGKRMRR